MVQFLGPEIVIMVQFLVQIFVSRILANKTRKNNLTRFWIIDEFNRDKKNPFEQKFFPFYEFLGPETDNMVQFLDPETDGMVQLLAPEIVIMGERKYIDFWPPITSPVVDRGLPEMYIF
jgi:hypothetical protein